VSNFYIVDLENFATTSRRYTGDIHRSTVVGLFMTHCLQLLYPGPASESIIHFPSTNSSETYITTRIRLIVGSFEAGWGGGCFVDCYLTPG